MVKSETMPEGSKHVKGYDFNDGVDFDKLMASYATHGFQASNLGKAINEIKRMRKGGFLTSQSKKMRMRS